MLVGESTFAAAVCSVIFGMVMVSFDRGENIPAFVPLEVGPSMEEPSMLFSDGGAAGNLNVCGNGAEVPLLANGAPLILGVFGAVTAPRRPGLSGITPSRPGDVEGSRGKGCAPYLWMRGAIED